MRKGVLDFNTSGTKRLKGTVQVVAKVTGIGRVQVPKVPQAQRRALRGPLRSVNDLVAGVSVVAPVTGPAWATRQSVYAVDKPRAAGLVREEPSFSNVARRPEYGTQHVGRAKDRYVTVILSADAAAQWHGS